MFLNKSFSAILLAITLSIFVQAETHIVRFNNKCNSGTPTLVQGSNVLSTGGNFKSDGPLISAIAYLQTGKCGFNGEECTVVETTLRNGPGSGSSTDVSVLPPHAFSEVTGFKYSNGCDLLGADCTGSTCPTAFFIPGDGFIEVDCQADNVNLDITFCG